MDDFWAPPQSLVNIEQKALAWRHALGVGDAWAPDIARLVETKLPKLISAFALIVRPDEEMLALDNAEAYTEFDPPKIAVAEKVYWLARNHDGRARMTFAHELGHLSCTQGWQSFALRAVIRRTQESRFMKVPSGRHASLARTAPKTHRQTIRLIAGSC
jgi:hypothetical protein